MAVATISNLTVRYGAKTAVSDLTVDVPEGCIGLLGPNGAGKTTLIKTLLGFLRPASGQAQVLGFDASHQGLLIRQRIGLMPEVDCHIPGMNAVTFVAYAGEMAGLPAASALARAHEVLEYCGLGEARYRNVETYSTGMKQRIKLAQALVHGPELVLLDEPTNVLDPAGRDEMLELVRGISHGRVAPSAEGGTSYGKKVNVIVSSHLLPDIERTCDQVIVLRQGQIAAQGDIVALRATQGVQMDVELRAGSEAFEKALAGRGITVEHHAGSRYRLALADQSGDPGSEIFLLFSTLVSRPLIYGLLFAFGWETWVPNLPGDFHKLSLMAYLRVLAPHPQPQSDTVDLSSLVSSLNPSSISAPLAWNVLVAVIVICLLAAMVTFSLREYAPRDAE